MVHLQGFSNPQICEFFFNICIKIIFIKLALHSSIHVAHVNHISVFSIKSNRGAMSDKIFIEKLHFDKYYA